MTSFIEISKKALQGNLTFIRQMIGPDCKLSSVVKGNAYGHGIEVFIPLAESCGIRHFSVFSADEALRVWKSSLAQSEIMIMGLIADEELAWAINTGISFYVFEYERLEMALTTAKRLGQPAQIHLELETGMNRTGFSFEDLPSVVELLEAHEGHFRLMGCCTHYAGAESISNHVRVQQQIADFNRYCLWLAQAGIVPEMRHTACSAACLNYPETRMDMVRIGILQYGLWPSREALVTYMAQQQKKEDPLKRLMSWKSSVMSIKNVAAGQFIGYGTSYLAEEEMRLAAIPVGYSHGYSRSLSNQGRVLLHGQRVGVVGMVNMNMMLLDVTSLPQTQRGDEVMLIGTQKNLTLSIASFGEFSNQLNYELLTRLPANIPRNVVD